MLKETKTNKKHSIKESYWKIKYFWTHVGLTNSWKIQRKKNKQNDKKVAAAMCKLKIKETKKQPTNKTI